MVAWIYTKVNDFSPSHVSHVSYIGPMRQMKRLKLFCGVLPFYKKLQQSPSATTRRDLPTFVHCSVLFY